MRRVRNPWKCAQELLIAHKVRKAPVDVLAIASKYATVVHHALDPDVSGVVAPLDGPKGLILVNEAHSRRRQRFSIAHELGHLMLHEFTAPHADRADQAFRFRDAESSKGSVLEEIQANQFAAELLMPRELVRSAMTQLKLDHAPQDETEDEAFQRAIVELAEEFQVSRQAMTIRLSNLFA